MIRELCAWCGLKLIELKQGRYCVEGQTDREEYLEDLREKILMVEGQLRYLKETLAALEFPPRAISGSSEVFSQETLVAFGQRKVGNTVFLPRRGGHVMDPGELWRLNLQVGEKCGRVNHKQMHHFAAHHEAE